MKIMQTRITVSWILQPVPASNKLFHLTPPGTSFSPARVEAIIAASGKPLHQKHTIPNAIALLGKRARLAVSDAAWYRKQQPTFADTLAAVRREIWAAQGFSMSRSRTDNRKLTKAMCDGVIHALCNAA
jgi:hypothetical protein